MKIAVFGSSGRTGIEVINSAKKAGLEIFEFNEKNPSEKKEETVPFNENKASTPDPTLEEFKAWREALYIENEALTKEKDQLLKERDTINTPAKQDAYNRKVNELNQRIEDYKLRVKEYNIKAGQ